MLLSLIGCCKNPDFITGFSYVQQKISHSHQLSVSETARPDAATTLELMRHITE